MTQGIGDFAALERDLSAALKHDGARWLEQLLNDPALSGKHQQCLVDEENYGPRPKNGAAGLDHLAPPLSV